ncbi:MAG: nucleotide exchange factor GrpE, partial [Candidatus Marinimicrobia bacterium]|nr:nucleotide exchange factor GrpE [Candidatus Neomarinimicrobiota bacterium]
MTEERSKQEKKAEAASSAQPPKAKKNPNKKTAEPAAESNAKAGDASEAFLLTREEIDTLILEHADLQLRCKEYQDKFLLLAAEFENFKKRTNKDQQRYRELYKENLLSELLPVIDDIERALAHHSDDELGTGFAMIHSKLLAYLENYGVVPFVSVGEEFDPE